MEVKSRARRAGVVFDKDRQRPSSSRSRSCDRARPHFFKIILPHSMDDMKLGLPSKFVREFGDELSTVAVLTVPNGCSWKVGLEKAENKIWFHDGWEDFVHQHSIQKGYFLVFKYEGDSNFHVIIFDLTATEIMYPSDGDGKMTQNPKLENQVEIIEADSSEESGQRNLDKNEMSTELHDHELFTKQEEDREMGNFSDISSRRRMIRSRVKEKAKQAATMFKPTNPHFISILRQYNFTNAFVSLPRRFATKYLSGKRAIELEDCEGKQWHCVCRRTNGTNAPSRIGKGWNAFCKTHNLKIGDACVFELIKKNGVVLKVSILPVA
ncbi:hypothetical protein I3760_06G019800 [Carya illinoinensis]|nr:hypothetical protein I3760_06G019800 [Carya illinoinensis]